MKTAPSFNPTPAPATPLVCRVLRSWSALSGEQPSRHAATCAGCQEYFRAGAALENALRGGARNLLPETGTDHSFEQRLLRAVRNAGPETSPPRHRARNITWSIGGMAAAAGIAGIAFFTSADRDSSSSGQRAAANAERDAAEIVDAVESFSNRLMDSVIPSAGQLVATNPLQQEIGSIYSDMRSAIDFLALNFLPPVSFGAEASPDRRI